jgi:hypothetical protein
MEAKTTITGKAIQHNQRNGEGFTIKDLSINKNKLNTSDFDSVV